MIRRLASAKPVYPIPAEVIAVNDDKTIDVQPLTDDPEFFEVRINADIQAAAGIRIVPKVGSKVFVLPMNHEAAIVVLTSEVEKIFVDCENIVFNGGDNALVKWNDLKAELDKTKEAVDAILNVFSSWTPVPNDGGGALKTAASSQLAGKTTGNYNGLEDETIKH